MKMHLLAVFLALPLLSGCYGDMGGTRLSLSDAVQACTEAGGKVDPSGIYVGVARGFLPQADSIITSVRCDITGVNK
ncbi:hypothetical protein P13BB106kb_p024 [Pectobacterium phage DU_PP_V]|uniref:Lipoprotein n=1 Tax=Pectobacterium phage DU_PP_V TaxID=2041492 RepID=A0A2D2W6U0_9CAUD|nr:Rz-like spanin [Pectobacterium phage DU_PP_V]ATS94008.1 hypothetical protein P13BB106kb_p024 [Pectobacterium phage DU_PP_V]